LTGGGQEKVQQVPLETAEQRAARIALLDAAKNGGFGNVKFGSAVDGYTPGDALTGWTPGQAFQGFNAGEGYGGDLGDYNLTGTESTGLSHLDELLRSGNPALFDTGSKALTDLLTGDKFDPYAANSEFSPFRTALDRETRDAQDAVKRNAAFSGNLYSTNTLRSQADVTDRANTTKASKLAELFSEYTGRKVNAIPLAFQAAQTGENINQNRIAAAMQYGGLPRTLRDTAAQRAYADWQRARGEQYTDLNRRNAESATDSTRRRDEVSTDATRRRNEQLMPLQIYGNVAGQNANFGVPEVSIPKSNPYMDLLSTIINGGSKLAASGAFA
jgi:hypothetical protein